MAKKPTEAPKEATPVAAEEQPPVNEADVPEPQEAEVESPEPETVEVPDEEALTDSYMEQMNAANVAADAKTEVVEEASKKGADTAATVIPMEAKLTKVQREALKTYDAYQDALKHLKGLDTAVDVVIEGVGFLRTWEETQKGAEGKLMTKDPYMRTVLRVIDRFSNWYEEMEALMDMLAPVFEGQVQLRQAKERRMEEQRKANEELWKAKAPKQPAKPIAAARPQGQSSGRVGKRKANGTKAEPEQAKTADAKK